MSVDATGSVYLGGRFSRPILYYGNSSRLTIAASPTALLQAFSRRRHFGLFDPARRNRLRPGSRPGAEFTERVPYRLYGVERLSASGRFSEATGVVRRRYVGATAFLTVPAGALCADAFVTKLGPSGIAHLLLVSGEAAPTPDKPLRWTPWARPMWPATRRGPPRSLPVDILGNSSSSNAFLAEVLLNDARWSPLSI